MQTKLQLIASDGRRYAAAPGNIRVIRLLTKTDRWRRPIDQDHEICDRRRAYPMWTYCNLL